MLLVKQETDQLNSEWNNLKPLYLEIQQSYSSSCKNNKRQKCSLYTYLIKKINEKGFQRTVDNISTVIDKTVQISHTISDHRSCSKQAPLSFLSPILTGLFALNTTDQLDLLKFNIESLRRRGDHLSSALGHSVAILNDIRSDVATNRHILNKLRSSVRMTCNMLRNTINDLKHDIANEFQFSYFINRLHSMIHIPNTMMRKLGLDLQMLQHDLSMAWSGRLSSTLLCSEQLRRLLNQIHRHVDRSLSLLFPLKKISEYYKHIPIIMALDSMTSIHLAMIIPLIPDNDQFELFQVIGIPQYFHNSLYTWDIESDYIAISTDQS